MATTETEKPEAAPVQSQRPIPMTGLELHVPHDARTVQSPVVPIRWCLSADVARRIIDCDRRQLQLLVVVVSARRQDRYIYPLDQLMAYVPVQTIGTVTILAGVLGCARSTARDVYLHRREGKWTTDIVRSNEDDTVWWLYGCPAEIASGSVEIDVPAAVFPPDPPRWERWWVELTCDEPAVDQCQYRRRRLWAYTLQPLWLPAAAAVLAAFVGICLLARMICVVLAVLTTGAYWIDWKATVRVPTSPTAWVPFKDDKISFLFFDRRRPYLALLSPPMLSVLFLMWQLGRIDTYGGAWFLCIIVAIWVTIGIAAASRIARAPSLRQPVLITASANITQDEAKELVCGLVTEPSIRALPPKRRTVRLRYQDLKAKVCRPYAK